MNVSRPYIAGLVLAAIVGVAVWWYLKSGDAARPVTARAATASGGTAASPTHVATRTSQSHDSQASARGAASSVAVPGSDLDMRTLASCQKAIAARKFAERQARCDDIPSSDTVSLNMCREQQTAMAQEVQRTAAAAAPCPAELGTASAYFDAVKSLAERGDVAAQRCFIQGYFAPGNSQGDDIRLKDAQVKAYPEVAKRFIDSAFDRGDWSVVRWLGRLSLNAGDAMLSEAYPFGMEHLDTAYRMKYLLMLGKQPDSQNADPRELTEHWEKEHMVDPEQVREGRRWAREMFDQHFNGSQEGSAITEYQFCERG
jgi:hypothetical protein